jgi:FtsP/CotA-like multicopper oxidase with cupredoxin domain
VILRHEPRHEPHHEPHHEPRRQRRSTTEEAAPATDTPPLAAADDRGASAATTEKGSVSRRTFLRVGASGAGLAAFYAARSILEPSLSSRGLLSPDGVFDGAAIELSDALYTEVVPTSPLILEPFKDDLPVPKALAPVPLSEFSNWSRPPGPGTGQQSSLDNERHQCWSDDDQIKASNGGLSYPDPLVYKIDVEVAAHSFTSSKVLAIDNAGQPAPSFDAAGKPVAAGTVRDLPPSTIYGFNGSFPGPMINAEYGKPALVRFENHLDDNPLNLDRQDFGTHDHSFLTHLHNGHTAPESDGNPHYSMRRGPLYEGYRPGMSVDNLYLNWPAGGDDREKQSFFWFHDHRMDHTGSNVYKGMVGLYPIYDPKNGTDMGDETRGLRLPGVRRNRPDGAFDVEYDIPLAIYDCRLDDGVTVHHDIHDSEFPEAANKAHPEWWGKTFFKHFPNHGFVGDIFTVNGTAYPTLRVKRRKYRFRFLDASIARIYEFKLMSSTKGPKAARDLGFKGNELQGQYRIPDGQQCMKFLQVASDGGLVPFAFTRDSFELWPAKRREMVVDFSRYQDGSPTSKGDVIYLTNVMKMPDGRMWSNSSRFSSDPNYKVPVLKIVIDDDKMEEDNSQVQDGTPLRELPPLPGNWKSMLNDRLVFEVQRGSGGGETEWLVNGRAFDPSKPETSLKNPAGKTPLAQQKKGSFNLWEIRNGGGGWVHPFHLHMEEHRTVMRNGRDVSARNGSPGHPDDYSREDLVALDPSESVIIYRGFRDFTGPYVAHCHNLAHEDHAMMFGWEIT